MKDKGRFVKTKEGYKYVSENGVEYSIYEGVSIGSEQRYTSDICFIMLDRYAIDPVLVQWYYGATWLNENGIENVVRGYVNDFEEANVDLVNDIVSGKNKKMGK